MARNPHSLNPGTERLRGVVRDDADSSDTVPCVGSSAKPCPSDETLAEFVGGGLSSERRADIERHLDECRVCLDDLNELAHAFHPKSAGDAHDEPPWQPGQQIGRYVVGERLGQGGMGMVFAAHDPELQRSVALKLLHRRGAAEQERLVREARAMAKLSHPNVAAVHDVGDVDGQVFVALELIEGQTLSAWTANKSRTAAAVLETYAQAGRGLAAAHQAGIVHRDFKPDNVMVGADGRVRVLDFGLARASATTLSDAGGGTVGEGESALTQQGALLGTPTYMSPEQHRGESADARSDQFSFCVALFESLYDKRPFVGSTVGALGQAVQSGAVQQPDAAALRRVPARVRAAIRRGLEVEPERRWPSMVDLVAQLSPVRARPVASWLAVGLIVAVGGGSWMASASETRQRREQCELQSEALSQRWTEDRDAVARAFEHDPERAESVVATLTEYASEWGQTRREACLTNIDGVSPLWTATASCLADRRRAFEGVVRALLGSDGSPTAAQAASRLPPLPACADDGWLARRPAPPRDPQLQAAVETMRDELAEADALAAMGRHEETIVAAQSVLERAEPLGYQPLEIEAQYWLGAARSRVGQGDDGLDILEAGAEAANTIGYDEFAGRIALELARAQGDRGRGEAAMVWARLARSAIARYGYEYAGELGVLLAVRFAMLHRLGGDLVRATAAAELAVERAEALSLPSARMTAVAANELGMTQYANGRYDEAIASLQRAVQGLEDLWGADGSEVATAKENLGVVLLRMGRAEEAEALIVEAIRVHTLTVGTEDPQFGRALNNLGHTYLAQSKLPQAVDAMRRSVAVETQLYGPQHEQTLHKRSSLALALRRLGSHAASERESRAVLQGYRKSLGPSHSRVGKTLVALAGVVLLQDRAVEAHGIVTEALEVYRERLPPDHSDMGGAISLLGAIEHAMGNYDAAATHYRRAIEIRRGAYPAGHKLIVVSELGLALAELETGQTESARTRLEQVMGADAYVKLPEQRKAAARAASARLSEFDSKSDSAG